MPNFIVVSQPMFLPWAGIFEQIKIADIFVYYDDVQMPQGKTFISRVQLKTSQGIKWLSVPTIKKEKQLIREVMIDNRQNWRKKHVETIRHAYSKCKFKGEVMNIVENIYEKEYRYLCDFNIETTELIAKYLNIHATFLKSSTLDETRKKSSERLVEIVNVLGGKTYITGLGALNYLNHELFKENKIEVEYMDYAKKEYEQQYGEFTPYVTILDVIANNGPKSIEFLMPKTKNWREMINL